MLLALLLIWVLVTVGSAAGLIAFLALDEWQVRSRNAVPTEVRPENSPSAAVPQLV